ncbi:DUF2975 domain-containing protein [Echinicola marina]|uniref:DUF2975 domain-containing protein n=1 Tax=Echinicola marina TaxID=2859768 RepID=UPI001CF65378|nr:DUF2975 domain-containing protein [Echinicola marina]UCS92729.1 DUF2975 domain-containing protein [Echinicola marina]
MKRYSTIFLQVIIVFIGILAFVFLLWGPHFEGRNVNATAFEIYFQDPFLAYVYIASIPFFIGLYQAFRVLGEVRRDRVFSQGTVKALGSIKLCAMLMIGLVVMSAFFLFSGDPEDRPPGITMRMIVIFISTVVAIAAAIFEHILQKAVDLKSENDLTV